ncbi:unnamed protein product [Choristocarpus tenellus]
MEVIGGEANTQVEVRESGCTFQFDFAKVYWNSRLQMEHARLIDVVSSSFPDRTPAEVRVCDMMAGVGPFAVPLARRGHTVFANDLNPESHSSLVLNARRNKCENKLTASNQCGRTFARGLMSQGQAFDHAILNLPNSALEFLDVFKGIDWSALGFPHPPWVHVYCFSKEEDPVQDAIDRANTVMETAFTKFDIKVHHVRDVAPKKPMLCLSFPAPDLGSGGAEGGVQGDNSRGDGKMQKIEQIPVGKNPGRGGIGVTVGEELERGLGGVGVTSNLVNCTGDGCRDVGNGEGEGTESVTPDAKRKRVS